MKRKIKYLRDLFTYIKRMDRMLFINIFIRIFVSAILPFAQLALSAQIITWLLQGLPLETYALYLAIGLGSVTLLQIIDREYEYYFDAKRDTFRLNQLETVVSHYLSLDYETLSSPEGQESFQKSSSMTSSPAYLFGRFMNDFHLFASSLVALMIYIGVLSQLEVMYLLIIAILMGGMFIFKYFRQKLDEKLLPQLNLNNKKYNYMQRVFKDNRLMKDIKMYQMKPWLKNIRENIDHDYFEKILPAVKLMTGESLFFAVSLFILTAAAIYRAAQLIMNGAMNVSEFILYVGSITLIANVLINFINGVSTMNKHLIEYKDMDTFLSLTNKYQKGPSEYPAKAPYEIELINMTYQYPQSDQPILKDINLTFKADEKIAIVGENGAGKTTLMKLLVGLLTPTQGEVLLNDHAQGTYNIEEYFSLFSPVFQDNYLLTYTIKESILQGLPYDEVHYQNVLKRSGMDQIIKKFSEGDKAHIVRAIYPDAVNLSGGQLQKLMLAQALYKDGSILILDEPTAALDPLAEHQVYTNFAAMSAHKMTFFVSHRLSSTRFCDRIIYLKNGQVTEMGTHEELMEQQKDYYRLYEAQAHYYRQEAEEVTEVIEQGEVI